MAANVQVSRRFPWWLRQTISTNTVHTNLKNNCSQTQSCMGYTFPYLAVLYCQLLQHYIPDNQTWKGHLGFQTTLTCPWGAVTALWGLALVRMVHLNWTLANSNCRTPHCTLAREQPYCYTCTLHTRCFTKVAYPIWIRRSHQFLGTDLSSHYVPTSTHARTHQLHTTYHYCVSISNQGRSISTGNGACTHARNHQSIHTTQTCSPTLILTGLVASGTRPSVRTPHA